MYPNVSYANAHHNECKTNMAIVNTQSCQANILALGNVWCTFSAILLQIACFTSTYGRLWSQSAQNMLAQSVTAIRSSIYFVCTDLHSSSIGGAGRTVSELGPLAYISLQFIQNTSLYHLLLSHKCLQPFFFSGAVYTRRVKWKWMVLHTLTASIASSIVNKMYFPSMLHSCK